MDTTEQYILAALLVIFILICIWHYRLCHQGEDACGIHSKKEGLHCNCARLDAAMYAWDPEAKLAPCARRFKGQMPYHHPQRACAARMYNPFWPPYGSAGAYIGASSSPYIDVPISRMVGDHVPLE